MLYSKNYKQGYNPMLRFDGFYLGDYSEITPIYFYANGSVLMGIGFRDTTELSKCIKNKIGFGTWGNYKIKDDTIVIETFSGNAGTWNMDRYLESGVIEKK